jgi:IS30 family transposase
VLTLTVDKGKEYADHHGTDQALGIQTYFADPSAAGSVAAMRISMVA